MSFCNLADQNNATIYSQNTYTNNVDSVAFRPGFYPDNPNVELNVGLVKAGTIRIGAPDTIVYIKGELYPPESGDVTLTSASEYSLVVEGTGPDLVIKGLGATGHNITLANNEDLIVIDCDIPWSGSEAVHSGYLGFGAGAGQGDTGERNYAFGDDALTASSTITNDNICIGYKAGNSLANDSNIIIGSSAVGGDTGVNIDNCVIIGHAECVNANQGSHSVFIGTNHQAVSSIGDQNVCIGLGCGININGGGGNVIIGHDAGGNLQSASGNICIGISAMGLGGEGVASNIAIGEEALKVSNGEFNIGIGSQAGFSCVNGESNLFIGRVAGADTNGSTNVVLGDGSVCGTGSSSSNNIIVGCNNGAAYSGTTVSNNIILATGWNGEPSLADTIYVGLSQSRCFIHGIRGITTGTADALPVLIDSDHQLGTISSSFLVKENIIPIEEVYDIESVTKALKPVCFNYIKDKSKSQTMGMIAQWTKEVIPKIVVGEEEDMTIQYQHLPILLLAEIQRLQKEIDLIKSKFKIN